METEIEEATPLSRSVISLTYMRIYAAILLRTLPQRIYFRIRHAPVPILPACSTAPSFIVLFARVAYIPGHNCFVTGTAADHRRVRSY